jgi:hypothetical protein
MLPDHIKKFCYCLIIISVFLLLTATYEANSWGFFAHKKINQMAVFTLPPEMIGFYKKHIDYVSEHAVDADKRRYALVEEAPRHYIDIEHYGSHPFDSIPKHWNDAVKKYSEDSLAAYGIVPWHIDKMLYRLQKSFEKEDMDLILKYSADIGHYIADAHVPLHTTENYNGQLTNQKGIHGFWESRIPELKSADYNYWTGKAKYIKSPTDKIWSVIKASHTAVDSVLKFEAKLSATYPSDKKYSFENRGTTLVKVYSEEYTNEYNKLLNGMVERRMREAIQTIGSLWYTAWTNAGKPDLNRLSDKTISDSLKQAHLREAKMWDSAKVKELKGH